LALPSGLYAETAPSAPAATQTASPSGAATRTTAPAVTASSGAATATTTAAAATTGGEAAAPVLPTVGENVEAIKTYARGDYEAAARMLEVAYKAGRTGIQDRLILARAYLHLARTEDALAVLKNVLDSDKENPDANSLTGQILLKGDKNEEALKYLEHAMRLKPDPVTASALGRCHYALGNAAKAKTYLTQALQEDVRDPSNSFLLGKIHLERGSGALAEKYLLMAQEAGMESVELHVMLGQAYLLLTKPVGPVMAKRIATPAKPGDVVDGCVVLGKVPAAAEQYKVCTRYCGLYEGYQLLKADKEHADGLFMVASGWFAAGDYGLAAQYLKALAAKAPGYPRSWDLRARLMVATKDFDGLRKVLAEGKAAKAMDSRMAAEFLCRAAAVLRGEGQRDQAIGILKEAEQEQPTSETVLRSLATLYTVIGDDKAASLYYARLVELFPDATDIDGLRNALKVLQEKTGVQQ
jgi:tetratricopeptide (TPR) repeat protein